MSRVPTDRGRIGLRLRPEGEVTLARAARLKLSERDSLRVLELLEHPPAAPDRLVRAATAGFALP